MPTIPPETCKRDIIDEKESEKSTIPNTRIVLHKKTLFASDSLVMLLNQGVLSMRFCTGISISTYIPIKTIKYKSYAEIPDTLVGDKFYNTPSVMRFP